jgi:hypothetical protein
MTFRLPLPNAFVLIVAALAGCPSEGEEARLDGGPGHDAPGTDAPSSRDAGTDGGLGQDGGQDAATPAAFACPSRFYGDLWAFTNRRAGEREPLILDHLWVRPIDGFEELYNVLGHRVYPFPNTGTTAKLLEEGHRPRVIRFTVPDPFPTFEPPLYQRIFFVSWPNGWVGGTDAYIALSTCPGDLRVPRRGQTGTPADPTFAEGCRNWRENSWDPGIRAAQSDLHYVLGAEGDVSTATRCVLVPGRTYYLNVYMAIPRPDQTLPRIDGPDSSMCAGHRPGSSFACGHGFSVQ